MDGWKYFFLLCDRLNINTSRPVTERGTVLLYLSNTDFHFTVAAVGFLSHPRIVLCYSLMRRWCLIDETKCVTQICGSSDQLLMSWYWKLTTIQIKHMFGATLYRLLHRHSFRLHHSNQNLGHRGLTWFANLHTKKMFFRPLFSFCMCELFLAECQKASLCLCLLCHISSSEYAPQPHPITPMKENKAGMSL